MNESEKIQKIFFWKKSTLMIKNEFEKIQKVFFCKNSTLTINHETLCNGYKTEGLKNIDIPNKIIAIQCSWIRRLYNPFQEWKLIPLYLTENHLALHLNFTQIYSLKVNMFYCGTMRVSRWTKLLFIV